MSEGYEALFRRDDSGALPPAFDDLWCLVEVLREVRPANVLEYGTGWSTYVIAETLARINPAATLTVVELDQNWVDIARSRLTQDAKNIVAFRKPEARTVIYNSVAGAETNAWYGPLKPGTALKRVGIATIAFPELHHQTPDLIYLDGPGKDQVEGYVAKCRESEVEDLSTIVSDPLFMKGPFTICIDCRHAQAAFLKANLPPIYDVKIFQRQRFTIFSPTRSRAFLTN